MPNLSVAFCGLATLALNFVTKRHLRLRSTPVPRVRPAVLLVLALLMACAAPPPSPPNPTPVAAPAAATPPPTAAAAPADAISTSGGVPSAGGVSSAATPAVGDGLEAPSADQRNAFAEARLLLVEGDFASAIDKLQLLAQSALPKAAQAEVRFARALALAQAGRGQDALQLLDSGTADSRDAFVRGLALDAANQHLQAMQSMAAYADANPLVAPAVWLEIAERELTARRSREAADATARALDSANGRPLKQRLLEVRAQALAGLGDNESAFDAHRQVLALATSNSTPGEQLSRLAQGT